MTHVKAQTHFDEPVTPQGLTQAIERGRKRAGVGIHATAVRYVPLLESLLVSFADHSAIALPIQNYPEFATLEPTELDSLALGLGGSSLCLEARDLHVSIAGLVSASKPLMDMAATLIAKRNGGKSSAVKVDAARANGKKGGRPRMALAG